MFVASSSGRPALNATSAVFSGPDLLVELHVDGVDGAGRRLEQVDLAEALAAEVLHRLLRALELHRAAAAEPALEADVGLERGDQAERLERRTGLRAVLRRGVLLPDQVVLAAVDGQHAAVAGVDGRDRDLEARRHALLREDPVDRLRRLAHHARVERGLDVEPEPLELVLGDVQLARGLGRGHAHEVAGLALERGLASASVNSGHFAAARSCGVIQPSVTIPSST